MAWCSVVCRGVLWSAAVGHRGAMTAPLQRTGPGANRTDCAAARHSGAEGREGWPE